jgi:hypothetical protein
MLLILGQRSISDKLALLIPARDIEEFASLSQDNCGLFVLALGCFCGA